MRRLLLLVRFFLNLAYLFFNAQLFIFLRIFFVCSAMLKEANDEMSLITVEKKEYMQKWKSSLIAMSRRDEALKAAENALQEQHQKMQTLEQEIGGYKASIRAEQQTVRIFLNGFQKIAAIVN
jgi:hypothetical protein